MNDAPNHLPRDLEALRYLDALNAGDLEAVAEVWERADRDPELRQMLVELDSELFVEARGNASPLREPSGRRRQPLGRLGWCVGPPGGSLLDRCSRLAKARRQGHDSEPWKEPTCPARLIPTA